MKAKLIKKEGRQYQKSSGKSSATKSLSQWDMKTLSLSSRKKLGDRFLKVLKEGLLLNMQLAKRKGSCSEGQVSLSLMAREGLYCLRICENLEKLRERSYS